MARPNWMAMIDPELRAAARRIPSFTMGPLTMRLFRLVERAVFGFARPPEGVSLREVAVGSQRVRVFTPADGPRHPAAILWMHGGGRVVGRPELSDEHCARLARELGIVAVSASYRLAPEHPYPAALDDLVAAWRWLVDHADELGVDAYRMAVGGESAGGGLAAELCQRIRDEGGRKPAAQVLVYPMLDDRTATRDELTKQRHFGWSNRSNRFGWASYLGVAPGSPEVGRWAAAARCEDLSRLPPAWLTVGTLDVFLDENLAYVERLRDAAVPVTLDQVSGGFHGFLAVGRDEAPVKETWESLERFLRTHLGLVG